MAQYNLTQTAVIARFAVQNSDLANIEEGQTVAYSKAELSSLGSAVALATIKNNVCLHFNSDVDTLSSAFSDYAIRVKYASVGADSTHIVGDTACTMTIAASDPAAIILDKKRHLDL